MSEPTTGLEPCPECGTLCRVERHKLHVHYVPDARTDALDVDVLAEALDAVYREKWPDQRESHHPPTTVFGGYATDIAAAYRAILAERKP